MSGARAALERWSTGGRPWVALVLLCLALYLPGMAALPPFDRDEARFVQATRQMLDTGDFVQIRFQDEARNKKPVGIHWLQATAVSLVSDAGATALWPYRLVSAAGATLAVLLTFLLGRGLFGAPAALLGAAATAGTLVLVAEAHLAKTDAALLAAALAVELALARIYLAARAGAAGGAGTALLLWCGIGVAALVKGPVVPALALLAAAALSLADRDAGWLRATRPLWGLPLALLIVGPWLVLVSQATDGAFLGEAVRSDLLPKLIGGQESHGAPPGYYLGLLAVTAWPASLFVPLGLWAAWRGRGQPAMRFALAWIVPGWLMFEIVPTKLPHYVLPLYPTLVLLAARAAWTGAAATGRWRWAMGAWTGLWALVGLGLATLAVAAGFVFGDGLATAAVGAALVLLAGGAFVVGRCRRDPPGAVLGGLGVAVLVFGLLLGRVLPPLDGLWLGRSAAQLLAREGVPAAHAATVGYSEPSLVFLAGTAIEFTDVAGAVRHLAAGPDRVVLIGDRDRDRFLAAAAAAELATVAGPAVRGFNYSRGRWTELTLYRRS
ncbi:glycosyltransferase family 39 protein [Stella sp.]|uniref:ArnT family glycosyltransferase n=1 Tax=Stella sp. TaxID=2912054 RepID=UPI0035B0BD0C